VIYGLLLALAMTGAFIVGRVTYTPSDRLLTIAYQVGYRDGQIAASHGDGRTTGH
jgi:hypothetical protein